MEDFDIKVSVYCLTYNHEKYIKSALDGFVNQKTDFKYEVIIHDDASTDRTAEIIKEYQSRYPEIIKPIYQTENQYSKQIRIGDTFIYPKLKGKYVAVCEGDDYWTDINKLQWQADFLDSHMGYSACAHSTLFVNESENNSYVSHEVEEDCDLDIVNIIEWKGKAYHTSSLMFRKEYFKLPEAFYMSKVGDYPRAIYLSMNGKIRYFKEVASVYRMFTEGSWSSKYQDGSVDRIIEVNNSIINMLNSVDKYSGGQYHEIIKSVQNEKQYENVLAKKQYKIVQREYRSLLKKEPIVFRLYVFMNAYFPRVMKVYYIIKSKFK